MSPANLRTELPLLALLALLWGSSYLFIKVAVAEIPPVTLIALRVLGATIFLLLVMGARSERLPRDARTWRMPLVQSVPNSIGAWTVLAWGQQYVDSGLASVLNSTSPIFVCLITALVTRHEALGGRKLIGAALGVLGVVLIVGVDALRGLGYQVAGQIACFFGAALYAGAAIYGKRFGHISAVATATGTMIWASVVLVPLALLLDRPWMLAPSPTAMAATAILSILCTGVALLIYFRLVRTLGSMGVASQSYPRAGIGVILGLVLLDETFTLPVAAGLSAAIAGVALINWPAKMKIASQHFDLLRSIHARKGGRMRHGNNRRIAPCTASYSDCYVGPAISGGWIATVCIARSQRMRSSHPKASGTDEFLPP